MEFADEQIQLLVDALGTDENIKVGVYGIEPSERRHIDGAIRRLSRFSDDIDQSYVDILMNKIAPGLQLIPVHTLDSTKMVKGIPIFPVQLVIELEEIQEDGLFPPGTWDDLRFQFFRTIIPTTSTFHVVDMADILGPLFNIVVRTDALEHDLFMFILAIHLIPIVYDAAIRPDADGVLEWRMDAGLVAHLHLGPVSAFGIRAAQRALERVYFDSGVEDYRRTVIFPSLLRFAALKLEAVLNRFAARQAGRPEADVPDRSPRPPRIVPTRRRGRLQALAESARKRVKRDLDQ